MKSEEKTMTESEFVNLMRQQGWAAEEVKEMVDYRDYHLFGKLFP